MNSGTVPRQSKELPAILHELAAGTLTVLCIEGRLDRAGVAALAEALKSNTSLSELNLNGHHIGDAGAAAIAAALEVNCGLKRLYLEDNNIGDEGAVALARALRKNHTLKTLFVRGNVIRSGGAASLNRGLQRNKNLGLIALAYPQVKDRSADHPLLAWLNRLRLRR